MVSFFAREQDLTPNYFPALTKLSGCKTNDTQPMLLRDAEQQHLLQVLASCNGDKSKASELLGISLATLYRKLGK